MNADTFGTRILDWYDQHGRKQLPWQIDRTPYRVWISEIMLQQTQVATVTPYFNRFMERFPNVAALAEAELDDVIAHWAGLGYYARARNLHKSAITLLETFGGNFPETVESVQLLPGIGRSTAGAIVSLGMGRWAPILDGNVKRVLCRHAGIDGWPGDTAITRQLWQLSETLTPQHRPADYNQGMMDLGATVCTKHRPDCVQCPLQVDCVAKREGKTASIPAAKPAKAKPVRQCFMLVLKNEDGQFWLESRPPVGIWGGMRSLPEFDTLSDLHSWCLQRHIDTRLIESLPRRRHSFSHYHLDFTPALVTASPARSALEANGSGWYSIKQAGGLPAPITRLLKEVLLPYQEESAPTHYKTTGY